MTVVNLIGASLFLAYVITFFVFTTNKKLLFRQFSLVVLVLITVLFYSRHEPDQKEMARILGVVCCTVTVFFFAAPMSKILHVIRSRNSECLPFPMIVANLIVCLQWVVYGVAIEDKFIQVSVRFHFHPCDSDRERGKGSRKEVELILPFIYLIAGSQLPGLHFSQHSTVALLLLSQSQYGGATVSATDTRRLRGNGL